MKIAICGSMRFSKKMLEVKKILEAKGHVCFLPLQAVDYAEGKITFDSGEDAQNKIDHDLIRDHYNLINKSDAILVLNYDKNGIHNYIGGNTLLEIGFAHALFKKIFLLNPIPDITYYKSEIEAMQPVVINNDLEKIK